MTEAPMNRRFRSSYDCVVVGAGNGGLMAAARLAKRGVQVLLLEQHNVPGGFASSFVRGRFEFEVALHEIPDLGTPSQKGTLGYTFVEELGIDIDWVRVPEAYRIISIADGDRFDVSLPFGKSAFIDAVVEAVPGSRRAVKRYFDLFGEVMDAFLYLGRAKGKPSPLRLITEHANFLKVASYTVQEVADALGVPKRAQDIIHGYWPYLGLPIDRIDFTLFAAMVHQYVTTGGYVPRCRSHEMSTGLARCIREAGGEIAFNTRVERILVESGQITAVETQQGDRIATRSVISNASPTLVYNRLIHPRQEVPATAHKECNGRIMGTSCFVVYLGLAASPEELGLDSYSYFVAGDLDSRRVYDTFGALDLTSGSAAVCLNAAVPDCSPPGTTILSLTTLYQPNVWAGVSPRDYFATKDRIAAAMVAQFEEATGTSLRAHVEEVAVATPQTMARYTGAYKGAVYGYEPEPWDSLIPRLMSLQQERHIQGLEFCGGFAARGHGYSSALASGKLAASITQHQLGKQGGDAP